ncbi:hypothetical protein GCM10009569_34560 [Arthrobacter russicus]
MSHPDTISTFEWGGKTYEIDWPYEPEDEKLRNQWFGAIYLDGVQVGECASGFGDIFTTEQQVLDAAYEVIVSGNTEDQSHRSTEQELGR